MALSPKAAYSFLCEHDPKVKEIVTAIYDWGSFYTVSVGDEGNTEVCDWVIDKESGRIWNFDIVCLHDEQQKHEDDYLAQIITINDLHID